MSNNKLEKTSEESSDREIVFSEKIIKKNKTLKNEITLKNFFSYSELEKLSNDNIIKIFTSCHLVTFISNIFLETQRNMLWFCCGKFELNFNSCKDVIFLPYEYKFRLMDILKETLSNRNIFKIIFDNGMIRKGVIYRRIIIQKSFTFIPLDKYHYKLTEYKIRGFCQIVEELGASKIEIDFSHSSTKNKSINLNSKIEAQKIAGDLGFSISKNNNTENNSSYILEYPNNNNLVLNLNKIIKNLEDGMYLISIEDYNTNLELQYVINSRCRHFITNYSTNFKIKNNSDFNLDSVSNLNISEINSSNNLKISDNTSDNILIQTNVYFNNKYRSPNNLLKYSVSCDEIGFNFIMNNIREKYTDDLPDEWIVFLWRFIKIYCYENSKNQDDFVDNDSDEINKKIFSFNFKEIDDMLNKIKQNFSLPEIIIILKKYFHINSQMVDFKNFLDIIEYKTKTYDELGFFLITQKNKSLRSKESTIEILKFIISKEKNNTKLKEYLQVYNSDCYYQIYQKLNSLGMFNYRNWNSFKYLINDSERYLINIVDKENDFENVYNKIYNNYTVGLSTFEFFSNVIPFIESMLYHYWYKKENLDVSDILIIQKSISEESFKFNNVTNLSRLREYLQKKIRKFNETKKLAELIKDDPVEKLNDYIKKKENEKSFIIKKILLIYDNVNEINFDKKLMVLYNILCFNERLNIHQISLDKYGFKKLKNNLLFGNFEKQFEKLWIPFILRYFNFHNKDMFRLLQKKYVEDKNFFKVFLKNHLEDLDLESIITRIIEEIL